MKRQLMTGLFAALAFTAVAQSNEWRDPEVNAVNRAPMHANFFVLFPLAEMKDVPLTYISAFRAPPAPG